MIKQPLETAPAVQPAVQGDLIRLTDREFTELTTYVKTKYGIDLSKKRVLIEGRLTQELRRRGIPSFKQYMDIVFNDRSGSEVVTLLNKLTTNLSYFMRENEHFAYLASQVLPYFEKTHTNRDLRIWSAGCSSGQEPYNIAMVIDEYFGANKRNWDTTILATDISMNVLTKAKTGIYTAEDLKDVPAKWKSKYFVPAENGSFQVCDKIRNEVVFRPFNLMDPFNFKKPFDLIFCRNVMIYFDMKTKQELVKKYYDYTANGGFLFIGHSESISGLNTNYTYIQPAIYQRRG